MEIFSYRSLLSKVRTALKSFYEGKLAEFMQAFLNFYHFFSDSKFQALLKRSSYRFSGPLPSSKTAFTANIAKVSENRH